MRPDAPRAPKRRSRRKSPLHPPDPWSWLEDIEDPATLRYLQDENSYYQKALEPRTALKEELYQELKGRLAEDDSSVPEKDGDYWYYARFEKGRQYPFYCRKKGSLDAPEEIYFDHNAIAGEHAYCDLGFLDISDDHRYLAYALDLEGDEKFTVHIRDLFSGRILEDRIEGLSSCFEWKESKGFFYIKLDELDRPTLLYYHKLGSLTESDKLIHAEKDGRFFLGLESSESESFIFLNCSTYEANEVWFHSVKSDDLTFHCIVPRESGHEYEVTHHGSDFLIISNWQATNYQLFRANVGSWSRERWTVVQGHDPDVLLEGLTVFESFWILSERHKGLPRLKVIPGSMDKAYWIDFPEEAYELHVSDGREYKAQSFRFWSSSPRVPQTLYDFHVATRQKTQLKRRQVGTQPYSEENYEVRRIWANARDGQRIPVTLLFRKDQKRAAGGQALVLHGYGSYGENLDCDFSSYRLSLVDRGYIYAMAHVRGGMEMGRSWYLDGKLDKKWNTFHDFIDVAEHLIREGWTRSGGIVAEGSSAGGMLMGVVANERPDLFLGIVASVPFVDVLNTMLDPELPLTTLEYNEWGDPSNPADYQRIKGYSPYDNVKKQVYPHILVVAGLQDQRVLYWEAAKWVAKLRDTAEGDSVLLFKVELQAGHSGATGRYDSLSEVAEELCFMLMLKETYFD